jgi:hypothetical protein
MQTSATLDQQIHDLRPGFETARQTFGKVSTWFEKSGDGKTIRLIRETVGGKRDSFLSKTEVVKTFCA